MSDTPLISFSASRVADYKACPKMFYEKNVAKSVPFVKTREMEEGTRVHKVLEYRVRDKVPLIGEDQQYERICQSLEKAAGTTFCELQIALDQRFAPCGWFDKQAYIRVIMDVMKLNGESGFMGDYKTGKPKFDEYQLKLAAAVGFVVYPAVRKWTTAYIWLKSGLMDPATYTREQLPGMWESLLEWPAKMQESSVLNNWRATPGWACGYCPVNKTHTCEVAKGPYRGN